MQQVLDWLKARLSEPSTWAGIGIGATAIGVALQSNSSLVGALIAGAVAIIKAES